MTRDSEKSACGAGCSGFFLLCGATVLLGWNEYQHVVQQTTIDYVSNNYWSQQGKSCEPKAAGNGKLVPVVGCPVTKQPNLSSKFPSDLKPLIPENLPGVSYTISSEIYQHVEEKVIEQKAKEGKDEVYHYVYKAKWVSREVSSSSFKCRNSRSSSPTCKAQAPQNVGRIPDSLDRSWTAQGHEVSCGWDLTTNLINQAKVPVKAMKEKTTHCNGPFFKRDASCWTGNAFSPEMVAVDGDYVRTYNGNPAIGDIRIKVMAYAIKKVSAIAQQTNLDGTYALSPYPVKGWLFDGYPVEWAFPGSKSVAEMLREKYSENDSLVFMLRILGFVMLIIGYYLIAEALNIAVERIPLIGACLGSITGAVTGVLAAFLGIMHAVLVISVAWLGTRPMLAGPGIITSVIVLFSTYCFLPKIKIDSFKIGSNTAPLLSTDMHTG